MEHDEYLSVMSTQGTLKEVYRPTTETVAFTGFPLVSAPPDTVLACAATGAMIPSTGTRARRKIHRFMA